MSVIKFMASDYLFGIFEPFLQSIIFQINEKQKTPKFKQTFYDDTNNFTFVLNFYFKRSDLD